MDTKYPAIYFKHDWLQILCELYISTSSFNARDSGVLAGLCVFHNEKTPSLQLYPDSKLYRCYGCGAHGNMVEFVIEYKEISEHPDLQKEDLKRFFEYIPLRY